MGCWVVVVVVVVVAVVVGMVVVVRAVPEVDTAVAVASAGGLFCDIVATAEKKGNMKFQLFQPTVL